MSRTGVLSATVVVALVVAFLAAMSLAKPAEAAFPGTNGKIAFHGYARMGSGYTDGIYTTLPASFGTFAITNITEGHWPTGSYPTFSPDGKKIAFTRLRTNGNDLDIYVMNANGTREKRLTGSASLDMYPAWSPDGTKIAYLSQSFEMDWQLYTINVDGTGRKLLTNNPSWDYTLDYDAQPDWSPDGQRIVFGGNLYDPATDTIDPCVYVINADGTGARQVRVGTSPAWSPNGQKIAYVMDGTNEIATMNPDGSHRTIRTNIPGLWVYAPDWQPRP